MAVFAHQHETQSHHHFAATVGCYRAAAHLMADFDVGNIGDANGDSVNRGHRYASDFFNVMDAPDPVNQPHFASVNDLAAANIAIVGSQRRGDLVERQLILDEFDRIDSNLILFFEASPTIDFGVAGNGPHLGFDDPIEYGPQLR